MIIKGHEIAFLRKPSNYIQVKMRDSTVYGG